MTVQLSSKGQLVIPKKFREMLGLKNGDRFHIRVEEHVLVLEPLRRAAVEALYGKYVGEDLLGALEVEHQQEVARETDSRT
jgi:AbrB family looped-hinge helix DNA binding protein